MKSHYFVWQVHRFLIVRAHYACLLICLATQVILAQFAFCQEQTSTKLEASRQFDHVPKEIRSLASQRLDKQSFVRAISILSDKKQLTLSRELLLQRAHSDKRRLATHERRRLLTETIRIAKAPDEPTSLSARAIRAMASLSLFMKEKSEISETEAVAEKQFLMDVAEDEKRDLQLRASAIKAIEVLWIADAVPLLEGLLADPKNLNKPEIARGSCLALMRIVGKDSIDAIGRILSETENPSIFLTAAYCLGQVKSSDSVATLILQREKFPDTGAMGFALVDMENEILSVLAQPDSPDLIYAVRSTEYLWRDGQKERYLPALYDLLLSKAPMGTRKVVAERLIQEAGRLQFEKEKKELRKLLTKIEDQPEFTSEAEYIRNRLSARLLRSETSDVTVPLEIDKAEIDR